MRISRMEDFGGSWPAGETVDIHLTAVGTGGGSGEGFQIGFNSSGSSGRASSSLPEILIAPALLLGFTSTSARCQRPAPSPLHLDRHRNVETQSLIGDRDIVVFVEGESLRRNGANVFPAGGTRIRTPP